MASAGATAPTNVQNSLKTPVTIITGFLGAGKTTLLNYILKEKGSRSIAVIENEFGEVNIDRELVAANLLAKEDLVSLENGCVCCSLRKDIVKAFAEIERRSRQAGGKKVDAIVLETTGLADPAPVAFTFFANPWIASRFRLDSIICVVDARYLMQHLEDGKHSDGTVNEAVQQIAFADLILLNKIDLVNSEEQKKQVLGAIRAVNNSARIVECQLNQETGRPHMDMLLFNNLFSVNRVLEQIDPQFLDSDSDDDAEDEEEAPSPQSGTQAQQDQASRAAKGLAAEPGAAAGADAGAGPGSKATAEASAGSKAGAGCCGSGEGKGKVAAEDEAAARTAGEAGPSGSSAADAKAKLLQKYADKGSVAGHKHTRDDNCEDNCEECHIVDGMPIKGERNPKRRAKRLHDLSDVSSVGIMARGPLDEYRFNMYMRDLLAEKAKDIFRCKGVLSVHGYGSTKFVFQGVHETICYGPAEQPWKPEEQRVNQVVFIGRGLNRKALIEGFRTCVWVPLPDGWDEFRDTTTKQPFYVNRNTGEKSWTRPEIACARVVATQGKTQQPSQLLPRRTASTVGQLALQQAAAAAAASGAVAPATASAKAGGAASAATEVAS